MSSTSLSKAHARPDTAHAVTAKIIAELERGVLPWRRPWDAARARPALPRRATGEVYRGVNVVLLWAAGAEKAFESPYWFTFKQAVRLGACVRKGERGEAVVYYGRSPVAAGENDEMETAPEYRFLKSYTVFNADQIAGLPDRFRGPPPEGAMIADAAHEAWFAKLDIARIATRDTAAYLPARDVIAMPPLKAFDTPAQYAATLNHEACHATGAPHRLDRTFPTRFGDDAYAAEELVAEIGAAILGAHLNLPPHHITDHAAYIGHWLNLLRNDKRAFLIAAGKAQAAVDWLLQKSPPPAQTSTVECADDAA